MDASDRLSERYNNVDSGKFSECNYNMDHIGSIRFPVEYYNIDNVILTASLKGIISTILASSLSGIIERIILADSLRMEALSYG